MEFSYRLIDSILLSSVALGLGLYAFRIDPKNGRNRLLLLICLWFVVRNTTALIAFAAVKERADLVALFKVNFLFYCTLFAMNLHFFLLLLGKRKLSAPILALVYLPMLAAGLLGILDPQKLIDFVYREGEWRIRLPPRGARAWLHAFNWTTLLYFTAALSAAILTLKRAKTNRERRQAAILLGGFSVYYVSQAVQPLLPRATSPSLLVYPLFAYIVSLCYATLRYSFLAPRPSPMTEDLIAHVSDAVFLLDADFAVAHSNQAAERLAAAGPLRGRPFVSLVRGGAEAARRLKTFQGGAELSAGLRIAFAREGNDAAATCYLSKVKDRFGDLVGILVIAKELPGRREFQDRFRVTGREMQVVDLILAGAANQAIGEALGISERTVEAHCLHVYNKLDVRNKTELVKLCAKYDFLP
jgi:DNA-binding CsgD family transcriptional regulator/PAS domain-containing protein